MAERVCVQLLSPPAVPTIGGNKSGGQMDNARVSEAGRVRPAECLPKAKHVG